MSMEQCEVHLVKATVLLKRVTITVRFPCSISFALKNQHNIVEHQGIYELKKGQCHINQPISIDLEVMSRRGSYEDKKISLQIFMISVNGKIPAGSVSISPTQQIITDRRLPLEKCPDKNAEAVITQKFQLIEVLRKVQQQQEQRMSASYVPGPSNDYFAKNKLGYSSSTRNLYNADSFEGRESPRTEYHHDSHQLYSSKYQRSNKDLRVSQADSTGSKQLLSKLNEIGKNPYEREGSQFKTSRVSSQFLESHEEEIQLRKSRISKLEQDKANYLQKISRMRQDVARVDSQEKVERESDRPNQSDSYDNSSSMEMSRYQGRRDSSMQIRELRDELDKRKSKIVQLDSSRLQFESQLTQKDKVIAQLSGDKKQLQQQLQQQKSQHLSTQKRLEVKQNSYKQQLKKTNQKYAQSETERQKALIEYNTLLASIENNEKRNQLAMRDKERLLNEEKVKLNKKIDQLTEELGASNQKMSEFKMNLFQAEVERKKLQEGLNENGMKVSKLTEEGKTLKDDLKNKEEEIRRLREENQKLEGLVNEDKLSSKRRLNQLLSEVNLYRDKIEKSMKSNTSLESKIAELQGKLQREVRQKGVLNTKIDQLIKTQRKYQFEVANHQKNVENLTQLNQSQTQKVNQLKNRVEAQKSKFNQMESKYEDQVKYLINSKQILQHQIEELKWKLEKQFQKSETLAIRNRDLNDQIIEMSHKVIKFEEGELSTKEEIQSKDLTLNEAQSEIKKLEQRIKQLNEYQRQKDRDIMTMQKLVDDSSREIESLKRDREHLEKVVSQKDENLTGAQLSKKELLKEKDTTIATVLKELECQKKIVVELRQQLLVKNNQLSSVKENLKAVSGDFDLLRTKSDDLKVEDQEKASKIENLENQIHLFQEQINSYQREIEKKKCELQEYKVVTEKALQQFFLTLAKDPQEVQKESFTLLSLPEENLSLMQMEAIKKNNSVILKYQEEIYSLTSSVKYFQDELTKQQLYIEQLLEDHSKQIAKQNQKYNLEVNQHSKLLQEINAKLHEASSASEEKTNELEYLNTEIRRYESVIEDLNVTISQENKEKKELKSAIAKLENEIFGLKEKQIKEKLLANTESDELKHLLIAQQEKNKKIVENIEEELKLKEKIINEKSDEIKKWMIKDEEGRLSLQNQSEQIIKLTITNESSEELIKNLEKDLGQRDKTIKELQHQHTQNSNVIDDLKNQKKILEENLSKERLEFEHLKQEYNSFKESQSQKYEETNQAEKKEREKRENLENAKLKLEEQIKTLKAEGLKLQSELKLVTFEKQEKVKKIQEYQALKKQLTEELATWRQSSLSQESEFHNLQSQSIKLRHEHEILQKEKDSLQVENGELRQKVAEMEEDIDTYETSMAEMTVKDKQLVRLTALLTSNEEQYEKNMSELRSALSKAKQGLTEKQNKIKELQSFVEDRYNDISMQKMRWEKQTESSKSEMQIRIKELEEKYELIQNEYEFQKEQAIRQIQNANANIQELNEVIMLKSEDIAQKEEMINEQSVRIEELTVQLNECVQKWQTEKEVYFPTKQKMTEINEELNRMNKFINDLDGRNKQLLEINKRKMTQKIEDKPSITQLLKEIYGLVLKNKNKILNRCQSDKEKEGVISEFKAVQEKLDLTLKSTQIVTIKQ